MDAQLASAAKPPTGRKMKARAPPPPGKAATPNLHSGQNPPRGVSPVCQQNPPHVQDDPRDSAMDVTVVLPSGMERRTVVNGSYAMMDLLVELCLQNHLNPSHHALEIWSSETQQPLSFKPNTLVGTLNVHTVFLKEKVPEEKVKPGLPKVPEKSVRLVVNYLRTQKAVVRVSPEVPLQNILPVICAKCDVSPEHVVLLRDNVAGEELELSKSLNELGIKELYAWDNKRETFRKSSLGNDETDKEKKKFLGFFKVNKRSNSKGCLTTPNSPSVNSRSMTLGPSLSLSNISGVSVRSDMKKRRAPPPPPLLRAGPPAQDKASEKVSLGSQMDLQKKKRRAPAPPPPQPPPPSPLVPTRVEDREENRKSATGVGRQVPQKPPRGMARGPPQLVLPPPPPYPPPDTDVAEPLGFPGEGAASEASNLRPTLSLPLRPGSPCGMDGAPLLPSEAEETVSVGSCLASEDTTEDSGVMSSPSDIVSLDSQHDSTKSKDKWATDQEDCSDQDLAGTPDLGSQKSPSWERSCPGNWHLRTEKAATASNDDRDLFVTGQFQQTLAELDGDLEEMEESYESDSSSLAGSINGVSRPYMRGAVVAESDADVIPVTFIGEVFDDPVESPLFSNKNNNAGSFDRGSAASRLSCLPPAQAGPSQQHGRKRAEALASPAPARDPGREARAASCDTRKDVDPGGMEPRVTAASELHTHDLHAQDRDKERGSAPGGMAQAVRRATSPPLEEKGDDTKDVAAPLSWCQRGQNPGGSFGLKHGLTTYKIVPPKSEMRCYDRGVSLSTGAIKIDELGNLVSPHVNGGRTIALSSSALEKETQPVGKVRESRRSHSVEKHSGWHAEGSAKRPVTPTLAAPAKPLRPESRLGAEPTFLDPKVTSPQQPSPQQDDGRHLGAGESRPPTAATSPTKVPAASAAQVLFLKPQRRTSSQYVASAIARRIGPPRAHADMARQRDNAGRTRAGRAPGLTGWSPAAKAAATSSPSPESCLGKDEAKSPCGHLPNTNGEEPAVGAHPRGHGKLSTQDCPAGTHRSSYVPVVTASHRDHVSLGQSCGFGGKQSTGHHGPSSASDPTCRPASTSPPPPRSGAEPAPDRALVNGSRWVPVHTEPPPSPRASSMSSHAVPEQEQKPSVLCTDIHDADGPSPPSIFGPKKKFRPVVQRPAPKDTSLHSALMEAIHSAGGKDRLRKTAEPSSEGGLKKPSYTDTESEHSALLAAIRGHRGASSLRKVTSSASEELRSFRDAARSANGSGATGREELGGRPPPALPPPAPPAAPALPTSRAVSRSSSGPLDNPVDARQALMDAIRSGTGAARLRKVPLLV
ncbi:cordon-bleu WH2 repeat protein [Rhinolophus ferrumequinum]|uniref:Cordon-bleu WH2 repeat protein n=1 Tax=Rhinolophus ferrumequinum TaxID=59479 RepID=A0A7J7TM04_RHIFE|nr:cordon-bleu WH2 repeat protein [Rhinolophus ferrumequinum]